MSFALRLVELLFRVHLVVLGIGWSVGQADVGSTTDTLNDIEQAESANRTFVDDYTSVRDFLLLADPDSRPYLRFLTLSPIASRVSDEREMKLLQWAVTKTLNSLSWQEKLIEPEIVAGSSGSLMVFDLRQLTWTAGNEWLEIVERYPYGLKFDYVSDPVLKQLAADVQELSQAEMPLLRADWFVSAVLQPPLYPELLQLPSDFRDLEQRLGVEMEQNIARGEVARAGISRSGMSPQNRLIERHEGKYGAVWVGYEFLPRRGKGDLLRFPLGPHFDSNSYNRHAFQADGRSVLFHLPNGMFGYYLVDSRDHRVDQVAETSLAFDAEAITGTPQMVLGLSCVNCHQNGLQTDFRDEIRSAGVLSGDALERVEKIYLTADRMQALAQRDQQVYLSALNRMASEYRTSLIATLDSGSSIGSTSQRPEPIEFTVTRYLRDLGPAEVAAELGLLNFEAIRLQIQLKPSLRQLGLGTLLQEQAGSIKRARWEAVDGTSLFQDVAVELGLGTPIQAGSTHKPGKSKPGKSKP